MDIVFGCDWMDCHARQPPQRGRARRWRSSQRLFYLLLKLIRSRTHSFLDPRHTGRMQFRIVRGMGYGMSDLEISESESESQLLSRGRTV